MAIAPGLTVAAAFHKAIETALGIPVASVSLGKLNDKSTWKVTISWPPTVPPTPPTAAQASAIAAVIAAFDNVTPIPAGTTAEQALSDLVNFLVTKGVVQSAQLPASVTAYLAQRAAS